MNKALSRLGLVLCVAGVVLCTIAAVAILSLPDDSLGAGTIYDEYVETYNSQIKEMAEANSQPPAPALLKTRQQAHIEDTMFGVVVGSVITVVGLVLWHFNRSTRQPATKNI